MIKSILYYIHDPMCSWCWGYRSVWDLLQQNLPESIDVQYVLGGLAPDTDAPMPAEQQQIIQRHWRTIQQKLGTEFNFDFWVNNTPRRSTYNACRAVLAAQNQQFDKALLNAIQQAYYLRALNPSDSDVLVQLVEELNEQSEAAKGQESGNKSPTIDVAQFKTDFIATSTQDTLLKQIHLARQLTNQGFPSLVLNYKNTNTPITLDYKDFNTSLNDILNVSKEV